MSGKARPGLEARDTATVGVPLLLGVLAGSLISLQSFSNARLSRELGSWIAPALLNNLLAASLLFVVAFATGSLRRFRRSFRERQRPPTWTVAVGANGAFYVTVMAGLSARVGVATMTLAGVFGQLVAGAALDHFGIATGGPRRISTLRVLGLLLAAASVGVGLLASSSQSWLAVVGVVAGVGFVVQQVGLGKLRQAIGEPVAAALAQICVGAVILLVLLGLALPVDSVALSGVSPEYCFGGMVAAVVIVLIASTILRVGAFGFVLCVTIGQTVAAVGFDAASPVAGGVPLPTRLVSVGLLLAAVVLNETARAERGGEPRSVSSEGGLDERSSSVRKYVGEGGASRGPYRQRRRLTARDCVSPVRWRKAEIRSRVEATGGGRVWTRARSASCTQDDENGAIYLPSTLP